MPCEPSPYKTRRVTWGCKNNCGIGHSVPKRLHPWGFEEQLCVGRAASATGCRGTQHLAVQMPQWQQVGKASSLVDQPIRPSLCKEAKYVLSFTESRDPRSCCHARPVPHSWIWPHVVLPGCSKLMRPRAGPFHRTPDCLASSPFLLGLKHSDNHVAPFTGWNSAISHSQITVL